MLTELFPYCLSISVGQMFPDNGLPHVSLEVGVTPTLTDEGQARIPNTTYNGYKMEIWKFA